MNPVTPTRKPINKHLALGGAPIAQDSPLGDLSNAVRDLRLGGGSAAAGSKGKGVLSRKGGTDGLPVAASAEVNITKDWDGPEAKLGRTKSSGTSVVSTQRALYAPYPLCCADQCLSDTHGPPPPARMLSVGTASSLPLGQVALLASHS